MFKIKKSLTSIGEAARAKRAKKAADFAVLNAVSGAQRSAYGDHGEMVSGAMNNNQKLATLQMMKDLRN